MVKKFYFAKVTDNWKPKNKLQAKAINYIQEKDATLIPKSELGKFISEINDKIKSLNESHKKSKPLRVDLMQKGKEKSLWVESAFLDTVFYCTFYEVEHIIKEE